MRERLLFSQDFPTGWQTEGGDREREGAARGGEAQVDVGGRAYQEDWEGEGSLGGGDHDDEDDDVIGASEVEVNVEKTMMKMMEFLSILRKTHHL